MAYEVTIVQHHVVPVHLVFRDHRWIGADGTGPSLLPGVAGVAQVDTCTWT